MISSTKLFSLAFMFFPPKWGAAWLRCSSQAEEIQDTLPGDFWEIEAGLVVVNGNPDKFQSMLHRGMVKKFSLHEWLFFCGFSKCIWYYMEYLGVLSDEQWILNGSAFSYTKSLGQRVARRWGWLAPTRKCYGNLRVPKTQCHQPLRNKAWGVINHKGHWGTGSEWNFDVIKRLGFDWICATKSYEKKTERRYP